MERKTGHSPSVPERALVAALGRLTISFSTLEMSVAGLIWVLIGSTQRVGQAVTAELPFDGMVNLFCSLYRIHVTDPIKIRALESLRKRLISVGIKRNRYVHTTWLQNVEDAGMTGMKVTAKAKRGLKFEYDRDAVAGIMVAEGEMNVLDGELRLMLVELLR